MKKVLFVVTCALSVGLFFNSCSMEKRHYMPGYHFDWNKNANHSIAKTNDNTVPASTNAVASETNSPTVATTLPASVQNTIAPVAVQQTTTTTTSGIRSVTKQALQQVVAAKKVAQVSSNSTIIKQGKKAEKKSTSGKPDKTLLYVLCVLIPWLAVGLATDWDVKQVVINLLLCLTCIGGIIHAFIVVSKS